MKWIILVFLTFASTFAQAHFIGEVFENSVWGKQSDYIKVIRSESKTRPDCIFYEVTETTKYDRRGEVYSLVVSKETGRIVSLSTKVKTVEKGALFAAFCCNGEVSLPKKALPGVGFLLENSPAGEYEGKTFRITLQDDLADGFIIHVECMNFMRKAP